MTSAVAGEPAPRPGASSEPKERIIVAIGLVSPCTYITLATNVWVKVVNLLCTRA